LSRCATLERELASHAPAARSRIVSHHLRREEGALLFRPDGSATRKDWARALVEVLPPIILAAVAAGLDGVDGVVGWRLGVVYVVVAFVVWWSLVLRFTPWRRV
jgi:hypothetical protein